MSKEPLFVTCPVCGKVNQKSILLIQKYVVRDAIEI